MAKATGVKRVGTTLTLVGAVPRSVGATDASIEITNMGAVALNACAVKLRSEGMLTSYTLADSLTDFSDVDLLGCVATDGTQGDPTALAPGASVKLDVPFRSDTEIEIWASVASGETIVSMVGEG
jgi:hypothetical protein